MRRFSTTALILSVCGLSSSTFAQESFEPFDSINGLMTASAFYEIVPESPCTETGEPYEQGYIEHSAPFDYYVDGDVGADAAEKCSLWAGHSTISSDQFRDLIKSRPPNYITSGHEWTFEMYADASGLGWAGANLDVEFTLNRPVHVTLVSNHFGYYQAKLGNIITEMYNPLDGDIIDYYHYDSQILGPGTHTLTAFASQSKDRGTILDAGATLWVRFDDAYCSPADLAEPFGMHDGSDIQAFVGYFLSRDSAADMNGDTVVDFADIHVFLDQFLDGCID